MEPLPAHGLHGGEIVSLAKNLQGFEDGLDLALDWRGFDGAVERFEPLGFANEDLQGKRPTASLVNAFACVAAIRAILSMTGERTTSV